MVHEGCDARLRMRRGRRGIDATDQARNLDRPESRITHNPPTLVAPFEQHIHTQTHTCAKYRSQYPRRRHTAASDGGSRRCANQPSMTKPQAHQDTKCVVHRAVRAQNTVWLQMSVVIAMYRP